MSEPRRHTLPRSARIRSRRDFARLFRKAARASDEILTVLAGRSEVPWARLGISVSGRFGNAIRRNRIKRLIREAFRMMRHDLPAGTDWVVIPKGGRAAPSLSEIRESLSELSRRLIKRLGPLQAATGKPASESPRRPKR